MSHSTRGVCVCGAVLCWQQCMHRHVDAVDGQGWVTGTCGWMDPISTSVGAPDTNTDRPSVTHTPMRASTSTALSTFQCANDSSAAGTPVGDVGVRIILDGVRCDVWCGAGRQLMCDCMSGPTRAHTCVVPARRSNHSQHHHKYATISSHIIYTCGQQVMGGWDDGPCAIPLALPGERAFTRARLLSSTAHGVLGCRDLDAGRRASHTQHQVCQHDGHRSAMDPAPSPAYARLLRRARDRSARARSTGTTTHA